MNCRYWAAARHGESKESTENKGPNNNCVNMNAKTSRTLVGANKACGNVAAVEIHKKRGFPQAAWKSLAQKRARLSHIPTGPTRSFLFKKVSNGNQDVTHVKSASIRQGRLRAAWVRWDPPA